MVYRKNLLDTLGLRRRWGTGGGRKPERTLTAGSTGRVPKRMCGSLDPFDLVQEFGNDRGYQSGRGHVGDDRSRTGDGGGFSLGGLLKDMVIGGVLGGLGSAGFYGAGKAVDALKESVVGRRDGIETANMPLTFEQALNKLQTVISRSGAMKIAETYNPVKARSSVYTDVTDRYLIEGHHTTVATTMLGRDLGFNMNMPTQQVPSATNIHWSKKWYEFWKRGIKVLD